MLLHKCLIVVSVGLLGLNAAGVLWPNDQRHNYSVELGYAQALAQMDARYAELGASPAFVEAATSIYARAIHYVWPVDQARIPPTDNWILYSLGMLDPLLIAAGLTNVPDLFSAYQSLDYTRGFRRGFGICSQNALGLADLLHRRYQIPSHIIGLGGHVIVEVVLPQTRTLHDPSLGVSMPYGYDDLHGAPLQAVQQTYRELGYANLAEYFDPAGNVREPAGVRGYRPKVYWLERAADIMTWLLPLLVLSGAVLHMRHQQRKRALRAG